MQQSCPKPRIQIQVVVPSRMCPLPSLLQSQTIPIALPDFHYSQYPASSATATSSSSATSTPRPLVPRGSGGIETQVVYRRNDPANRTYKMKKRPPAQVYFCVQCNKNIKYPSKITEHIRKHTGEKPHVCGICGQSFSQSHTLKSHMMQHGDEKPWKCSFCHLCFDNIPEKSAHEEVHLNHPEALDSHTVRFIPPPIEETMCHVYECPENCGFRSLEEADVIEHISMGHHHPHQEGPYEAVCWGEEDGVTETVEVIEAADHEEEMAAQRERPRNNRKEVQNRRIIVQRFTSDPDQVYEYFNEQFVPQVAQEAIIEQQQPPSEGVVVPQEYFHGPSGPSGGPSGSTPIVVADGQMVYEGEEEIVEGVEDTVVTTVEEVVEVEEEKVIKGEMIQEEGEEVEVDHIYENMIIHQQLEHQGIGPEEMDEDDDEEEEEQERVRVVVNPNPPKRGTKSLRDQDEASAAMTEMIVDASTLEMVAPIRLFKSGNGVKKPIKQGKKRDWIIDAVAKGVDVNEASPHVRKKPTLHKCEYCGKVDKYPSKIRAHMRTHTGEKPFKCDICGMQFSQRTPLRLHLRRHLDQKPYQCEVPGCHETFVSGAIRKLHMDKKHYNKKKYMCMRGCGRVFSSVFNQRHHEKKCAQNTYQIWVEDGVPGTSEGGLGPGIPRQQSTEEHDYEEQAEEEYQEVDDEYIHAMHPTISEEPIQIAEHFAEEPVFLHQ